MIHLLTDFGHQGPYVGQIKAVLQQLAPGQPVIDVMHDLPSFQVEAASYLLPALLRSMPAAAVTLCVVDPGVGGPREPIALKLDGNWLVGPDNGLFDRLVAGAEQVEWHQISWQPEQLSASFHGRDLFAPVAAAIARGEGQQYLSRSKAKPLRFTAPALAKLVYIDGYGNCMTGMAADSIAETAQLMIAGQPLAFARTFCEVEQGELFWYRNSLGLVEIAANQASAQQLLGVMPGSPVAVT